VNKSQIKLCKLIWGEFWQTPLAKELGINSRRVRAWFAGDEETPNIDDVIERAARNKLEDLNKELTAWENNA
jgi:hypothetical protein